MGEEVEKKEEEKKEEEKKEEEPQQIVLKVDMHCEACARKVARCLKGFEGVEDVSTDYMSSKVVVKGKRADPIKVCERIQRKSGRKVELISPLPKPVEETKEEPKEEAKEEQKEEPPTAITVVLNVRMHCDACAQLLQRRVRKLQGVESVETDFSNDKLIVKGIIDPTKLAEHVYKKTRKKVTIVKEPEEEKKEEEKKEDEKKDDEIKKAEEDKKSDEMKRSEYLASRNYIQHHYAYSPPHIFSDENPNACSVM